MACFQWEVEVEIREEAATWGPRQVGGHTAAQGLPFFLTHWPFLISVMVNLAQPFPTADPKVGRSKELSVPQP